MVVSISILQNSQALLSFYDLIPVIIVPVVSIVDIVVRLNDDHYHHDDDDYRYYKASDGEPHPDQTLRPEQVGDFPLNMSNILVSNYKGV